MPEAGSSVFIPLLRQLQQEWSVWMGIYGQHDNNNQQAANSGQKRRPR
jgi:hypothetical protein